jgi:hypothetical protein
MRIRYGCGARYRHATSAHRHTKETASVHIHTTQSRRAQTPAPVLAPPAQPQPSRARESRGSPHDKCMRMYRHRHAAAAPTTHTMRRVCSAHRVNHASLHALPRGAVQPCVALSAATQTRLAHRLNSRSAARALVQKVGLASAVCARIQNARRRRARQHRVVRVAPIPAATAACRCA